MMRSDELKLHRVSLGLTQVELAMVLEVHEDTVARWEMPKNAGRYPVPKWVAREMRRLIEENVRIG